MQPPASPMAVSVPPFATKEAIVDHPFDFATVQVYFFLSFLDFFVQFSPFSLS
jgi:hypothetical protein